MNPLDFYFSPNYFTARDRFRRGAAKAGARLDVLAIGAKGPAGEDLTIDIAWFGSNAPKRLLLHSSGLHGVEGFAGSAIQLQLLDNPPVLPGDAALVVVHILNPYGMSWLRRVNENNVDLNRNFRVDGSYQGAPSTYAKLDHFLNPRTAPAFDFFGLKAIPLILRHGMAELKQSFVGGQYEFPEGLFFGGKQLEEGPRKYHAFLVERLASAEKTIAIDVHTGIGKYAEDMLLVESMDFEKLRGIFGERVTALVPDQRAAYRIEGGIESMLFRVFGKRPMFVGQEFGTYSGIRVLHALREENRWHHYGRGSVDHPTKLKVREAFYPADESWRRTVLKRGHELLEQAIAELARSTR
jgi:Protein of unknown function (DUF2817)